MKRFHRALPVLAAASAVALLAACAPGGAGGNEGAGVGNGVIPFDFEGELNYWGWQGETALPPEIEAFNEVYPNIEVTYKQLDTATYTQLLTPGLLSDSGPDLFQLGAGPMAAQFAEFSEDLSPLAVQTLGDDWRSKLSPLAVDSFFVDAQFVAAPTGISAVGTWLVNKSILDELDLEVPDGLTDLAQLEEFCATVVAGGYQCLALGGSEGSLPVAQFHSIAESAAAGSYAEAIDGELEWTDPGLVDAFSLYQSLFSNGVFQDGAVSAVPYPDVWADFMQGKVAMTVLGTWTLGVLTTEGMTRDLESNGATAADTFTAVLIPAPDLAGSGSVPQLATSAGVGDAINVKAENREAAEAYIAWKQFSEAGQQFQANILQMPSMVGVSPQGVELIDPAVQEASLAVVFEAAASSSVSNIVDCPDVYTALADALQRLGIGDDVNTVAADLQKASAAIDRATCSA